MHRQLFGEHVLLHIFLTGSIKSESNVKPYLVRVPPVLQRPLTLCEGSFRDGTLIVKA